MGVRCEVQEAAYLGVWVVRRVGAGQRSGPALVCMQMVGWGWGTWGLGC